MSSKLVKIDIVQADGTITRMKVPKSMANNPRLLSNRKKRNSITIIIHDEQKNSSAASAASSSLVSTKSTDMIELSNQLCTEKKLNPSIFLDCLAIIIRSYLGEPTSIYLEENINYLINAPFAGEYHILLNNYQFNEMYELMPCPVVVDHHVTNIILTNQTIVLGSPSVYGIIWVRDDSLQAFSSVDKTTQQLCSFGGVSARGDQFLLHLWQQGNKAYYLVGAVYGLSILHEVKLDDTYRITDCEIATLAFPMDLSIVVNRIDVMFYEAAIWIEEFQICIIQRNRELFYSQDGDIIKSSYRSYVDAKRDKHFIPYKPLIVKGKIKCYGIKKFFRVFHPTSPQDDDHHHYYHHDRSTQWDGIFYGIGDGILYTFQIIRDKITLLPVLTCLNQSKRFASSITHVCYQDDIQALVGVSQTGSASQYVRSVFFVVPINSI